MKPKGSDLCGIVEHLRGKRFEISCTGQARRLLGGILLLAKVNPARMSGRYTRLEELARAAAETFSAAGNDQLLADALGAQATALLLSGMPQAAEPLYRKAMLVARRSANMKALGDARINLGIILANRQGGTDSALRLFRQALETGKGEGLEDVERWALFHLADMSLTRGQHRDAFTMFKDVLRRCVRSKDKVLENWSRGRVAHCLLKLDRTAQALRAYRKATASARESGDPLAIAYLLKELSEVYEQTGDERRALRCRTEAAELFETMGLAQDSGKIAKRSRGKRRVGR